jgi:hypothetical protein
MMNASVSWRQRIREENERLGIKPTPRREYIEEEQAPPQASAPKEARPRHEAGRLNGLEKRYAQYLEIRRVVGEIRSYKFECIKFRLAPATFFNVDFLVWMADGSLECHEVKGGFFEDDARVKTKVVATLFPEFKFIVAREKDRKRAEWTFEELKAE